MAETSSGADAGWFTLRWRAGAVELLDQRQLPGEECYLLLREVDELAEAIETLAIRGAPAIGCAAAMGVALGAARSAATARLPKLASRRSDSSEKSGPSTPSER